MENKTRFVNRNKTRDILFPSEWDLFWGITKEDLEKAGWVESNDPLITSDTDCVYCEGFGSYSTISNPHTLHIKCHFCDGTGKKLNI